MTPTNVDDCRQSLRALICTDELFPDGGGVGRYAHVLADAMASDGVDISVVAPVSGSQTCQPQRLYGVEHIGKPGLRSIRSLAGKALALVRVLNSRNRPDVLVTVSGVTDFIVALLHPLIRQEIVVTIHGSEIEHLLLSRAMRYRLLRPWVKALFRRATSVVCVSDATRRRLIAAGREQGLDLEPKACTVPNGIESTFWDTPRDEGAIRRIRERCATDDSGHPTEQQPILVLTVARLDERKDHEAVIRALPDLPPHVHYLVPGRGSTAEMLRQVVEELGLQSRVHFLGFVPEADLVALYDAADMFVLPCIERRGRFEGFGLVLVEAMARGTPPIAYASGGTPEVIENGVTGLLVEEGEKRQLRDAIAQLAADESLRHRLGRQARRISAERFGASLMARRTLDILDHRAESRRAA